jgi:hypothetical protein
MMRKLTAMLGAVAVAVSMSGTATAYPTEARPTITRERFEARVPVCAEDERAVGVGDYSGSDGWARWQCVHMDALAEALGI